MDDWIGPDDTFAAIEGGLAGLATQALEQVERAIAAWLEADEAAARAVIAGDAELDRRSDELETLIMGLHMRWTAFAGDLRLLHVGLIEAVALERVGNLAVAIADLTLKSPPPGDDVAGVQEAIRTMGERAVDALAAGTQAIARKDLDAAGRACALWHETEPMLDHVISEMSRTEHNVTSRRWSASAVLVARHLERVANNACELGSRTRFLVTGEDEPVETTAEA